MKYSEILTKIIEMIDNYDKKWEKKPAAIVIPYLQFIKFYQRHSYKEEIKDINQCELNGVKLFAGENWMTLPTWDLVNNLLMDDTME